MKKFLIIVAMFFVCNIASAQFKVTAGYLNSKITDSESGISISLKSNGFYAGVLYDTNVGKGFSFEPGLLFDYTNFKIDGENFPVYWLRLPMQANYTFAVADEFSLFLGAGPSLVIGLGGKDKPFADEGLNRIDLQLGAKAGIRVGSDFEVRLGYDWGLLKAFDDDELKFTRNSFSVGLAYIF